MYREKKADVNSEIIVSCAEFAELMTAKAKGKRINYPDIRSLNFIEPLPYEEPEEEADDEDEEPFNEEDIESVDDAIAKDIFKEITVEKGNVNHQDNGGDQLSLFDE